MILFQLIFIPSVSVSGTLDDDVLGDRILEIEEDTRDEGRGRGDGVTLYVDAYAPDGGDGSKGSPLNSIQDGVDAALAGDTIRVLEGRYYESVKVTKAVFLQGEGAGKSILDCGNDAGFLVTSGSVSIVGFEITGNRVGSGIKIESDDNYIGETTIWNKNYGIYLYTAHYNTVEAVNCSGNFVGMFLEDASFNTLTDSIINENEGQGLTLSFGELNDNHISNTNLINGRQPQFYYGTHGSEGNTILLEDLQDPVDSLLATNLPYIVLYDCSYFEITEPRIAHSFRGILIQQSSDCTIQNAEISTESTGIKLDSCDEITVEGAAVENCSTGISLFGTTDSMIENNVVQNTMMGIDLDNSDSNEIRDNNCSENERFGIFLHDSSTSNLLILNECGNNSNGIMITGGSIGTIVAVNECWNNFYGIYVTEGSKNATISANECWNNQVGILLEDGCVNSTIDNNTCTGNVESGIQITGACNNTKIAENECNDNQFGIWIDDITTGCYLPLNSLEGNTDFGIFIEGGQLNGNRITNDNRINGGFLQYYFQVIGTEGSPVVIKDISDSPDSRTMTNIASFILMECENVTLKNVTLSNSERGILLEACANIEVQEMNLSKGEVGIMVLKSSGISIHSSQFDENDVGIEMMDSWNSTISQLTCRGNDVGISIMDSEGITIDGVRCEENTVAGIQIGDDSEIASSARGAHEGSGGLSQVVDSVCEKNEIGISIIGNNSMIKLMNNKAGNNTFGILSEGGGGSEIIGNDCSFNSYGLQLLASSESHIEDNTFSYNTGSGISLTEWSDVNTIRGNLFIGNERGIFLENSSGSNIENNTIDNSVDFGIYFFDNELRGTYLRDNTFNGDSPNLFWDVHGDQETSIVIANLSDASMDSRMINIGFLIIINCSYIHLKNITIERAEVGVYIEGSDHMFLEDFKVSNSVIGMGLIGSFDVRLKNITVIKSENIGIMIIDCMNGLIEKCDVSASKNGISITDSSDIIIYQSSISNNTNGISLYGVSGCVLDRVVTNDNLGVGMVIRSGSVNNEILNCTVSFNMWNGIYAAESSYNILRNNSISGSRLGLGLGSDSMGFSILENTISHNTHGILLAERSSYNVIRDNIIHNNSAYSIWIYGNSDLNEIDNNSCSDTSYGIYIEQSSWNNIFNNKLNDCREFGIYFWNRLLLDNRIMDSNSINGLNPTVFFDVQGPENEPVVLADISDSPDQAKITNLGFIIIHNSSNIVLENITIDFAEYGIHVENSTQIVVGNSTAQNIKVGITVQGSEEIVVVGNSFNGTETGIVLLSSQNCRFESNNCTDNTNAIYLEDSNWCELVDNICESNEIGILLYHSSNNSVGFNRCVDNDVFGIQVMSWLTLAANGYPLVIYSFKNHLYNNTITGNKMAGVNLSLTANTTMENNTITGNKYGIELGSKMTRDKYNQTWTLYTLNSFANYNQIYDNDFFGIFNAKNGMNKIVALYCWWGDGSGPFHDYENPEGTGEKVTDFVDFDPWIGKPKTVYNSELDEYYYTIQEAVDKAEDGQTIRVHAGIYIEEVEVTRSVTIQGNGTDKTIIRAKAAWRYLPLSCPYQIRVEAIGVNLFDMTLQGNGNSTTNVHVVSSYNHLWNLVCKMSRYGITIENCSNNLVERNDVSNNSHYGINIVDATDNTITNNLIMSDGLETGMNLLRSRRNLITGNEIVDSSISGVFLQSSQDNKIIGNNISNPITGIRLKGSSFNTMEGNNISQCFGYGISMDRSPVNLVVNNILEENSFGIIVGEGSSFNTARNNSFINNEIGFKVIYAGNASILENEFSGSDIAIITKSSHGNIIHGNMIVDNEEGIMIYGSIGNQITWNTLDRNAIAAINATLSGSMVMELNDIGSGNDIGILMNATFTSRIANNTIHENRVGVLFRDPKGDSNATYNNFIDNTEFGVRIEQSTYEVNATNSYWGAPSGPYHPLDNPDGEGDPVGESVFFEPFATSSLVFALIQSIDPLFALDGENITFTGDGYSYNYLIENYEWSSSIDGLIFSGSDNSFTTSTLSNGTHHIRLRVQDSRGIWSAPAGEKLIVNGRPRVSLEGNSRWILEGEDVTFRGTATDDGTIVQYSFSTTREGLLYLGSEPEFTWVGPSWGERIITFKAMDEYGTWSLPATANFGVYALPEATIVSITPQHSFYGETIQFQGEGKDDIGISTYMWRDADSLVVMSTAPSFEYAGYSNGTHRIEFRVRNTYGVWSTWVEETITVNGIPKASIVNISPNPAAGGELVEFLGMGYDNGKIVKYIWTSDLDGELYNGSLNSFSSHSLTYGRHNISLKVLDDSGVWSSTVNDTLLFSMKPFASILSISPNPAYKNEIVKFEGNGTDDGEVVLYSWRSDLEGELFTSNFSYFNKTNMNPGTHTIYLKVKDDLGVWSDEVSSSVVVKDNARPMLYVLGPENGTLVSGTVEIFGTTWDDTTVTSIEYRIGSGSWKIVKGDMKQWSVQWDTTLVSNGNRSFTFRAYDGEVYSDEVKYHLIVENKIVQDTVDTDDNEEGFLDVWLPFILIFLLVAAGMGAFLFLVSRGKNKKRQAKDGSGGGNVVDDKPLFKEMASDDIPMAGSVSGTRKGSKKKGQMGKKGDPIEEPTGRENIPLGESSPQKEGFNREQEPDLVTTEIQSDQEVTDTTIEGEAETGDTTIGEGGQGEDPIERKTDGTFARKE